MTDDIDNRIYKLAKANAELVKEIAALNEKVDDIIKIIKYCQYSYKGNGLIQELYSKYGSLE